MKNDKTKPSKWYIPIFKAIVIGIFGIINIYIYFFISNINPENYVTRVDPIVVGLVLLFFILSLSTGIMSVAWNAFDILSKLSAIILGSITGFIWGTIYLVSFWGLLTNVPEYSGFNLRVQIYIHSLTFSGFILLLILIPVISTAVCSVIYYTYMRNLQQNDDPTLSHHKIQRDNVLAIIIMLILSILLPLISIYLHSVLY